MLAACFGLPSTHDRRSGRGYAGSVLLHADIEIDATANSELTISVDGFAEFHNEVRGWHDGWQTLSASVRTLAQERIATGAPLKLRANVVLMHDNISSFAALCEELADWGVDEITFNQLGGRDRPEFFPEHRLRSEDAKTLPEMVAGVQRKLALRGVRLCAGDAYLQRIQASADLLPVPVPDCQPGQRFLFIDERGRVAPCHFTGDELGIPLAQLTCADDLLKLPEQFSASRKRKLPAACRDCPSTQVFEKFTS